MANIYSREVVFNKSSACEGLIVSNDVSEHSDIHDPSGSTIENSELRNERLLCKIITEARDKQRQVQLIHSKGELRLDGETIPSSRFLTNVPSTSLANLLHCSELSDKNKMILSYLLVESVWQYFNCGWEDWSDETIHFMSQRSSLKDRPEVIYVNQPFLHVRFYRNVAPKASDSIPTADEGSAGKGELQNSQSALRAIGHEYPKILALGIMLLEIQLGNKLEFFKTSDIYDKNPNVARYLLASDILKNKDYWPPKNAWKVIKEIIETCIHGKKGKLILRGNSQEVRQSLYDNIVAPFRVFILGCWEQNGFGDVEPVRLEKVSRSEERESQVEGNSSYCKEHDQRLTQS